MSKRTISVPIDCEDKTCGECDLLLRDWSHCKPYKSKVVFLDDEFGNVAMIPQRLEECIKAELASLPFEKQYAIFSATYKAEHKGEE